MVRCVCPWQRRVRSQRATIISTDAKELCLISSLSQQDSSTSAAEAGGGYATRRGHGPHLSISDPSHHVTEAIGHMYDDDEYDKRDSRRLSYISSPLGESISTIPPDLAGSASPTSPQSMQLQSHLNEVNTQQVNGPSRPPPLVTSKSFDRESSPGSPGSSKTDTATTSFPLNDVDYESNPAAVAQELNNLAAIRRMSMDAVATSDPDLPDFSPSVASPSDDENDASGLFWVPARLHPELAPMEFRSFLESRSERIKRRSTDFAGLSPEGPGSGSGLRRKRSMLSREIDNSHGYTDGAERLERKRSQSKQDAMSPNLLELESLVDDSKQTNKLSLNGMQGLSISADEDKPILPPMPQAPGLRRSTRTQYRKAGSVKKGDRPRRFGKSSESNQSVPSIVTSPADQPILGLTRVSTDPTPSATRGQAKPKSPPTTPAQEPASSSSSTPATASSKPPPESSAQVQVHATEPGKPLQSRQVQSRVVSNGRSSPERNVSAAVEPPPANNNRTASQTSQQQRKSSGRGSESSSSLLPRKSSAQKQAKENTSSLNDFANSPQALPGNTTRTDSLSFIPTFSDDRKSDSKSESKRSKERKDSEGGSRKSSWHWLLGTEEKDKDKEKKKDKDSDSKRIKSKLVDKVQDSTNSHHSSNDSSNQQRRESFAMDRPDLKLDDDRKKDNTRRSSGESKKEKESGLFSSIFGGGRKKHNSSDSNHKKSLSRNFSPDPPVRELQPDVDYPWTRFPILEERAIYRMAHIKLANPRRALHSQVLLSNFMYSYLAKVQQMHPHMTLVTSATQRQQQAKERQEEEYQQQYQRYQEVSS